MATKHYKNHVLTECGHEIPLQPSAQNTTEDIIQYLKDLRTDSQTIGLCPIVRCPVDAKNYKEGDCRCYSCFGDFMKSSMLKDYLTSSKLQYLTSVANEFREQEEDEEYKQMV